MLGDQLIFNEGADESPSMIIFDISISLLQLCHKIIMD